MPDSQTSPASPTAATAAYDIREVEDRWQARWRADRLWELDLAIVSREDKYYNLVEFPYPSAEGLHVGHFFTYGGADTIGRYYRMRGKTVFQPIGFDSFGIHTENFALKSDQHPMALTAQTVANYRRQMERLGIAWNWEQEVVTNDPDYYRWTQWIFVKLFKAGLAVQKESSVVWCPTCLTVLAFEQLEGDACERCATQIENRVMTQWFLKITDFADRLVDNLADLDWTEAAKRLQADWIGRSHGADITFAVKGLDKTIDVFTTRPDTLYGATFMALAVEHPLVAVLAADPERADGIAEFVQEVQRQRAATTEGKVETETRGVFTGSYAIHPLTGAELPVYVADYVLVEYGSGAIMGVPAHDERDWEFATHFGIDIVEVVSGGDPATAAYPGEGPLVNSGEFTGVASQDGRGAITARLAEQGRGEQVTRFRMHDWLISRQRYWGPPIPIIYCSSCGTVPVPEDQLPVILPEVEEFRPTGTGKSPLALAEDWVNVPCPECGEPAKRETDVSDTFVDSSWYFLRYPSVAFDDRPWDAEHTARMLPVDRYAGGPEHVMRHHLYARFVTMALHDLGHVPFEEPFTTLRLHGLVVFDGAKMSKSRGNVINPDDYIDVVGAGNLRMYLLFCGPWEQGGLFSDEGLNGIVRFNKRLWKLLTAPHSPGPGAGDLSMLDISIAKMEGQIERVKFNTAIATLMELTRWLQGVKDDMTADEWERAARTVTLLLAPFNPHMAEELWALRGGSYSVHFQPWPAYDPAALVQDEVTLVVQVNGKVRGRVTVPAGLDEAEAKDIAVAEPNVARYLDAGQLRHVVFVPDKLINLVL